MEGNFEYPYLELEDYPGSEVPPGEQVRIRAHYYAYAPEQEWYEQAWTVTVVIYESGGPPWPILGQNDTTHLTEGPHHSEVVVPAGTMPNRSITYLVVLWANLSAWKSFPENGSDWVQLDARYFTVNPLVEAYEGKISRKELEYDSEQETIPAIDVQYGLEGLVHIWGRNDTTKNQKMGIEWWVRDPRGVLVEHYYDWETLWTGPGNAQHFIGDRFDLDIDGNWTIQVNLLMNPDAPEIVDTYQGRLCNVLPEAATYEGTITRKELEYNGDTYPMPVSSVTYGVEAEVHIYGRNDSPQNQKMGIRWWVRDPDGRLVQTYSDWETFWTGPGNAQHFVGPSFTLDKASDWTIDVELLMNPDNPVVVDSWEGRMCSVLPEAEYYEGKITNKQLEYDGQTALIPAVGVGLGQKGKVRIEGRNDTEVNQKMGVNWVVKNPAGTAVQNYTNWETFWTGPGNVQTFVGPSITFDQSGQWTITVNLLMNQDNPVTVDSYQGNLCEVGIGAEEEFQNLEITEYEEKVGQMNPVNVKVTFEYRGPPTSRKLYAALWQSSIIDPHDEVAHGEVTLDIEGSAEWTPRTGSVAIYATCDPGIYGLYAKLNGIIPEIISPYYPDVVTVEGGPAEDLFPVFDVTYASV